jgi:hypothetical protein
MRLRLLLIPVVALCGYAVLLFAVWSQQDRLVFPGAGRGERLIDVAGVDVSELPGLGGTPFRVVQRVPDSAHAVLAWFVGNGEDLSSAARRVVELSRHGIAVVAAEYPGYGGSRGTPAVASLLAAAEALAIRAEALARERSVPFVVGGSSLGSFCALHVAAAGAARRCLLVAPPTSLADVAAGQFWWLPVRLLLRHRFDNTSTAPQVRCPVLVLHGDQDEVVPVHMGEALCRSVAGPAEFVVVRGAGHNDVSLAPEGPLGPRIAEFLRGP